MDEVMIVFDRTACAIQGEGVLLEGGLCPLVMPLPSRLRAGCGICLRVRPEMAKEATALLGAKSVDFAGLYLRRVQHGASEYEPLP